MAATNTSANTYDVVVIGGGSAGSNAARAAADTGARTLMIHRAQWWNLCVQRGCMPSKSLLAVADTALTVRHAGDVGVAAAVADVPFGEALGRKDEHVARFANALQEKHATDPYDIEIGDAAFINDQQVRIETEDGARTVTGSRFVIATGSKPFVPPITGLSDTPYVTSDDVMENALTRQPDAITILGGGPIGLEFATFFAGMGTDVTVIEMQSLLAPFGERFGAELRDALCAHGNIRVLAPATAESVSYADDTFSVSVTTETGTETVTSDTLLGATGRTPAFDTLGLDHIGITPNPGISHTEHLQATDAPNVYVAGDVTKDMQLLHVAAEEGRVAGYNAGTGENVRTVDHDALNMSVIFSSPPVAHVGMTEPEAAERGDTVTEVTHFPETGRAITMGVQYGYWSLIADAETGTILGATIVGPRADDLIHEVFLAKRLGATVHDIAALFGYHPTLSEQFFSLASTLADRLRAS